MIPIVSLSFSILDSSSMLIIRIWLRRLNRQDIVWISSSQIRTPRVPSSCRSAFVRSTTSSSVLKISSVVQPFFCSLSLTLSHALRSSVSIWLFFTSITLRNYENFFVYYTPEILQSEDSAVVFRCVRGHFVIMSDALFYERLNVVLVRHIICGIWRSILSIFDGNSCFWISIATP